MRLDGKTVVVTGAVSGFARRVLGAGAVDGLVNGAGWGKAESLMGNEPEFRHRVVDVNLMGPMRLVRAVLRPMARHSIHPNCVCPGPTETPMPMAGPEPHQEAFLRAIPRRRFGKPGDVADAVLFLASDRADCTTGQVLSVSCGPTMV